MCSAQKPSGKTRLEKTSVANAARSLTSFGGFCAYKFNAYENTEGTISAGAGRNLWRYMLLKVFVPSYERMVQPSFKPSVAVSAVISTLPETATPY